LAPENISFNLYSRFAGTISACIYLLIWRKNQFMHKKILTLLFAMALILAACQGAPANGEGEFPTEVPPVPTNTALPPTPVAAATATGPNAPAGVTGVSQCTVVSRLIAPDPTEASLFPQASASDDWMIGPETAAVTIIEYSDFQ
jgi:hypothetical protein